MECPCSQTNTLMENLKMTSAEAGILLSRKEKKEIVGDHFHELMNMAFKAIDDGQFNKAFCPCYVLNYVVEKKQAHEANDEIRVVEKHLSKKGNYEEYEIGRYMSEEDDDDDDDDWCGSAPIADFEIEHMVDDITFDTPVNGKFNINYPFDNVIFVGSVTNAESVGEILSHISAAYESIYERAEDNGIGYVHGIDELVFEDSIRIYANGTIEYSVGS